MRYDYRMETLRRNDRAKKFRLYLNRMEAVMYVIVRVVALALMAYMTYEVFYIREIIEHLRRAW